VQQSGLSLRKQEDAFSDLPRIWDSQDKTQPRSLEGRYFLKRPRILLADDHVPMIERVRSLLQTDFEIVGNVSTGPDLVSEAGRLQPDIIVLDITMPGLTGIEAAHELRQAGSTAKFVFLSVHERVEFVRACLAEGALGYVVKSRLAIDLVPAVVDALAGRRIISPPVSR
jgi:DNA-binding NarL/FixJ family response regulator